MQERFLKVSEMWTSLSKKDKMKYKEKVKEGQLKYQKELQKWFQVCDLFCSIIKSCRFIRKLYKILTDLRFVTFSFVQTVKPEHQAAYLKLNPTVSKHINSSM